MGQANPRRPLSSDDPSLKRMQSMAYGLRSQVFTLRPGALALLQPRPFLSSQSFEIGLWTRQKPTGRALAKYLEFALESLVRICSHISPTSAPGDETSTALRPYLIMKTGHISRHGMGDFQRPDMSRSSAADLGCSGTARQHVAEDCCVEAEVERLRQQLLLERSRTSESQEG